MIIRYSERHSLMKSKSSLDPRSLIERFDIFPLVAFKNLAQNLSHELYIWQMAYWEFVLNEEIIMAHREPAFLPFCPVAIKLRAKTLWRAPTIPGRSSILVTMMALLRYFRGVSEPHPCTHSLCEAVRDPIDSHIWWLRQLLWDVSMDHSTVCAQQNSDRKAPIRPWYWNCIISCTIAAVRGT